MKKIRKYIFAVFSIAIVFIIIFNFRTKDEIYVGLVTDLSGSNSNLGVSARNGLLLAIDEINISGGIRGRQLELVIKDHKGSKSLCLSETKELITYGVDVIISPILSGMASTVLEGTSGSNILIFGPTVSTDELTGIDDNFLRVASPSSSQGTYLADVAINRNDKEVAIIVDGNNSSYTMGVLQGYKNNFENIEGNVIHEFIFKEQTELTEIVHQLESIQLDGIVFVANGIDSAKIIQLYGQSNKLPHLYGSSWVKASEVHKFGGKRVEGMIIADALVNLEPKTREKNFMDDYRATFHSEANSVAIYFYESIILYKQGITLSKSFSADKIKKAIIEIDNIDGITEDYYLDEFGDGVRSLQLFIIKNGIYEYYK